MLIEKGEKGMALYDVNQIRQQCIDETKLVEQAMITLKAKGCDVYFAKDVTEAKAIVSELCASEQIVLSTFSCELNEIALQDVLPQIKQTDLEAVVAQGLERPYYNPRRAPLDDVSPEQITTILKQYFNLEEASPSILQAINRQIKLEADRAAWGITGLDGIYADTGTIIIAEDQGNGRIVSNIPARHLAIVGLEKIYPSNDAALESIHAAWKSGGRQETPVYYSYITGPSRTGDIEGSMVCGMHGPLAVHVVLLDNGRSTLLEQGKGKVLKCIECGKCSDGLYQLLNGQNLPIPLTCKTLALKHLQMPVQISDAQWDSLVFTCPVGIQKEDLKRVLQ